jgi:hypothetical protein
MNQINLIDELNQEKRNKKQDKMTLGDKISTLLKRFNALRWLFAFDAFSSFLFVSTYTLPVLAVDGDGRPPPVQ